MNLLYNENEIGSIIWKNKLALTLVILVVGGYLVKYI